MTISTKQLFLFSPFIACLLVYLCALPIDIPEVDAAQYAGMAIEMFKRGEWLHITDGGRDYLDKPPLVFWTAALCYKLFGISNISYKIPSLLFWLLGIVSTYKLAARFYSFITAYIAALLLATCEAGFMITNDCRTDTLLTGAVIFSLWQLMAYIEEKKILYFLGGFTGIALAMLAKGPIGLMVPVLALATHFIFKQQWRNFFRWEWIVGIIWVLLLLSPMLWGLYTQFDLHPEKIVNGESNVSGIKFFFWTQSFGRITGESQWKDDSDFFFLWHTSLWAFLPWGIMLFGALFTQLWNVFKAPKTIVEYFSLGGFLLPLIALSLSHYKLPHYIFVTYPLAAILTANYISQLIEKKTLQSFFIYLQGIIAFTLAIAAILIPILSFPHKIWQILAVVMGGVVLFLFFYLKEKPLYRLLIPCIVAAIWVNLEGNLWFYPQVMQYQACTQAGYYLKKQHIPLDKLYIGVGCACAIDMPIQQKGIQLLPGYNLKQMSENSPAYILIEPRIGEEMLQNKELKISLLTKFPNQPLTSLSLPFLLESRRKVEDFRYLLKVEKP